MTRTIADVEADIEVINTALTEIISGKRVNRILLRSADFMREYFDQPITENFLLEWRDRLYQELYALQAIAGEVVMRFRPQTTIPLNVTKFGSTIYRKA